VEFEQNGCPCAVGANSVVLFETKDFNFDTTDKSADFKRCVPCGSLFPDIFPTAPTLFNAYSQYYTAVGKVKTSPAHRIVNAMREDYLVRNISTHISVALDFGCGSGAFLRYIHDKYPHLSLFGYDAYPPAFDQSAPFKYLDRHELVRSEVRFDYITMGHVIEHLTDPELEVALLAKLLKPGGMIWISTPNADSFLIRGFSEFARDVDFPRHKVVFSKKGLREFLEKHGLVVSFINAPTINAVLNFVSCFKNVVKSRDTSGIRRARILFTATCGLFLYIFGLNRSANPEIIAVAQKPDFQEHR